MNILSLSNEVLYQIFDNLDCLDILAARSTCWRLRSIGKTQLLWQSKVQQVAYSSGIPVLEAPMEAYTSEELEAKLIKRARTRQKWCNLDSANFESQHIGDCQQWKSRFEFRWLPGGRWLLCSWYDTIYMMDLDEPVVLEPDRMLQIKGLSPRYLWSNIWTDTMTYWLPEARTAFYCASSSFIYICQFSPSDHGSNMTWRAKRLANIGTPLAGIESELHIEKEYVLAIFERLSDCSRLYLYNYSGVRLRLHRWVCDYRSKVFLLPKDRIGTVTQTHLEISVIKPLRTSHLELQQVSRIPLAPIPGPREVFNPYSTLHFSYLNLAYEDTLLEIRIPVDTNEVYQKKITFDHGPVPDTWGPSLLVRLRGGLSMEFISYELNDSTANQVASQHCTIQRNELGEWPTLYAYDVTSGQLIVDDDGEYMLIRI